MDGGRSRRPASSASNIFFDFGGNAGDYLLFQHGPGYPLYDGQLYYCTAVSFAACSNGESIVPGSFFDANTRIGYPSGNAIIASAVPEPGVHGLLAVGFAGLWIGSRRRSAL